MLKPVSSPRDPANIAARKPRPAARVEEPEEIEATPPPGEPSIPLTGVPPVLRRYRPARLRRTVAALLMLMVPTIAALVYCYGFMADQYVSEARFSVRGQNGAQTNPLGALLMGVSSMHSNQEDALSIESFILSHDAVAQLEKSVDLRALYSRPEADWLTRLPENATAEDLESMHRRMVEVSYDQQSGVMRMRAFAFRPEDAKAIATALLDMSEQLVNKFSDRAREDMLRLTRQEVANAEDRVHQVRAELTRFRKHVESIDPSQSSMTVLGVIGALEGQLAQTRAEIAEQSSYMRADNPSLISLRQRERALQAQIEVENQKLTGINSPVASTLADYEKLLLEKEFADRAYASALTSLETTRMDAQRQQLYLIRVVNANLPEESLYPRRWLVVLSVLGGSIIILGIGGLVVAGIRDHAL